MDAVVGEIGRLQPRIDRFALQREDREGAFVDAVERFAADEAFEGFEAEGEFAQGERAFRRDCALLEAHQVLGRRVLHGRSDPATR